MLNLRLAGKKINPQMHANLHESFFLAKSREDPS